MHWLSWEPLCEPSFYVFVYEELHPGWSWLAVKVPYTPGSLFYWPFQGSGPGVSLTFFFFFFFFFFLLCGLFCEAICFKVCLVLFCSCVFRSFEHCDYLAWGRERANLSAFRAFVRFVLVWFCRFPLPFGGLEGLRFVIVALPGLSSYLFWHT